MILMKKSFVSILLCLLVAGAATPVSAQGFLKDLKNKAGKTLKDASRTLSPTSAAKTGVSASAKASSSTTDSGNTSTTEPDETPEALKGIHHGSIDEPLLFTAPQTTASTVRVTVENDLPSISDFHDGAAYIYSYPQKAFFIDKKGHKLFETDMAESNFVKMPRFDKGVFMEIPALTVKKPICIRDKQGRVVKEFPKASGATQFKDGKAIIVEDETNYTQTVRYVDTKGNYIYPDLSYKTRSLFISLEAANRNTSEGLTAFCIKKGDSDVWKWGFYNSLGKIAIAAEYDAVGDFHDGLAAVMTVDNGVARWGFIDKNGRQVIAPRFTVKPSDFDSGYSLVIDKSGDGYYMDRSGQFKLGPVHKYPKGEDGNYVYISPFYNGYAVVGFEVKDIYGFTSTYYCTVDANLNRLGWAKLSTHLDMTRPEFIYYEGRYYIYQNYGGEYRWMQIDPRNFDRVGEGGTNIYSDGLRRQDRSPLCFVNDKNELVIVVEESKF